MTFQPDRTLEHHRLVEKTGEGCTEAKCETLLTLPWEGVGRGFDVTPDGQSFVMVEATDPGAAGPQITVVQNWAAEFAK